MENDASGASVYCGHILVPGILLLLLQKFMIHCRQIDSESD